MKNEKQNNEEIEIQNQETDSVEVTEKVYTDEEIDKIIRKSRRDRYAALALGGLLIVGASVATVKGCSSKKITPYTEQTPEETTEIAAPKEITDEIEITKETEVAIQSDKRASIEANRTYSFSQIIASINHYPEMVEKDGLKYWDVNKSAGQVTVTRPYGEMSEQNPHNEKVEIEFYPNDEQAIHEWDVLDIRENLPCGAFWIKTDSTGGKVKIEFFDAKGEVIKVHDGEMVMAEWTDTNGVKRQAIQFKDAITGETRPASFQMFEIEFKDGKPDGIKYPYSTAKITVEPTPGSYLQVVTGSTIPYGPGHDQGFGFYLWENQTK